MTEREGGRKGERERVKSRILYCAVYIHVRITNWQLGPRVSSTCTCTYVHVVCIYAHIIEEKERTRKRENWDIRCGLWKITTPTIGTIAPGGVSHQLGSLMDWFSTALDLAGISKPEDRIIDGISLLPLFMNGTETNRYNNYYSRIAQFVQSIISDGILNSHRGWNTDKITVCTCTCTYSCITPSTGRIFSKKNGIVTCLHNYVYHLLKKI